MGLAENKAVVEQYNRSVMIERDLQAAHKFFPAEYIDHSAPSGKSTPDDVIQSLQGYFAAFPDFAAQVESMHGEGDLVVTRMRLSGTHQGPFYGAPPTGKKFDVGAMLIFRVQGDKLVERWFWVNMLGLRQQLGLQ